ncbi:hypothetical protein [Zhenpiania hominis]|uniref:hypothetical protein n=1 Tax=Zhenpiania hominis TaxID=2763644 RepID=UPI0039F50F4C
MRTNLDNMKNKNVLVIGLGKSGIAALQAMLKLGAVVSVQDSKPAEEIDPQLLAFLEGRSVTCYFGKNPEDMSVFDILILSPGVSPDLDFIQEAQKKGAKLLESWRSLTGSAGAIL